MVTEVELCATSLIGTLSKNGQTSTGIAFLSVKRQLFSAIPINFLSDQEHGDEEDRWVTIGLDSTGVLRVVIHTFEQPEEEACLIRVISARRATGAEEKQYQDANR